MDGDKASLATTFSSFVAGVYIAVADGPLADKAIFWKEGDPTADHDDTPRPTRNGAGDDAGADRPAM